ncbi:hypothetical protein [Gloeothece verrucosa]|uniref:Uncharacterized protein n=1 Tax=Gloeothece verrucosa (strain PCC 7822) TaxID=497965 RepID=E0UNI4_GLOV7|nr:hypothetical protein [Gloeothece verrucosa]ADN18514.1 hypothetical protein Cyan7822_6868 [Gloeothece verrucosa PCC 7822]
MKSKLLNNHRTAVTETFSITIPVMPNQHYWLDGSDWEEDYPGSIDYLMLCSPCGDPLYDLRKNASQEEAEAFIRKDREIASYLTIKTQ